MKTLRKLGTGAKVTVAMSLAHFVNDASFTIIPPVLPILIEEFRVGYGALGAVITASVLTMTSMQAVTGYIADRCNRITFLLVGLIILGAGTVLIGFSTNYIQLLVFGCVMGIGGSVYHPIGYSLLSDAFEFGNRGKALGLGSAAGDLAIPVVFATSGFLTLFLGWRSIFTLWGLVIITVAVTIRFVTSEPGKKISRSRITDSSTKETVVALIPLIVVMGLAAACYRIVTSFTTTYLSTFGLSIGSANAVTALMMTTGAIGSVIGGTLTDKLGAKKTISIEMFTLGVLSVILAYVSNRYLLYIIIALMGFALLGVWPSFYSVIARRSNLGSRAFIYGLLFAIARSFGSFFPFISGFYADVFGLRVIYILVGVLSLLAAFTVYFTFKR